MTTDAEPLHKAKPISPGTDLRPVLLIALSVVALAVPAALTFRRATTPWSTLPDYDYWDNIRGLVTGSGLELTLSNLFRHNNEHIVVIPKLIYAANYLIASGSNTGLIIYSIVVGATCSALLLFFARDLLRDTPGRLALCAVLFPLAMFSAKLTHSYFRGMSGTIWLTADLFVILSAAALAKAVVGGRTVWLLASLLAGLLGVLAYSTAVYSLIVLLGFALAFLLVPRFRGVMPAALLVGTIAVIAVVLGLGIAYRNQSHLPWTFDLFAAIRFVLTYLGNALTMGSKKLQAPMAPMIGLAILAIGAVSIRRLSAQGRINDALLWIILFFYAPFNAVMTGIGRLSRDDGIATASRYQSVTAISLIATIALLLAALPKGAVSRRAALLRAAAIITLLLAGVVLLANRAYLKHYTASNETKVLSEIALRLGIEGQEHLRAPAHAKQLAELDRLLPDLRGARHVPFNTKTRCEELLGQRLNALAASTAGSVDAISTYTIYPDEGQAMQLKGWAAQDGTPAECIVVIDGSRTAIGAGASMLVRPDIERDKGRPLGRVGWRAVATLPTSMPVCALALFPGESQALQLANCQESLAATTDPAEPKANP